MMHFRIIRVDHGLSHSTMLERERDEAGTDQAHEVDSLECIVLLCDAGVRGAPIVERRRKPWIHRFHRVVVLVVLQGSPHVVVYR